MEIKELDFKKLGKRIKKERLKNNLTQEQVAEMVGLSSVHMSHVETGSGKMSLSTFVKICNALKATPDYVLLDSIYTAKEYIYDDIAALLKQCSDHEIHMIQKLLKTYVENK